jgi:hypothetical protein
MTRRGHRRVKWLVLLGWIGLGVCAFLAYCPMAHQGGGEYARDGLGRVLYDAPRSVNILLLGATRWAGADWLVADVCVLLGATIVTLLACGRQTRRR